MDNGNTIIITAYGHGKVIDKIAVNSFEYSDAEIYCNTINSLKLKDDSWVYAKMLSGNTEYSLDAFMPVKFPDLILKLDNLAVQRVLRETDSQDIAKSLKDQDENVKEKIFSNLSKKASQMLKEDMEYMGPINIKSVKECQEKMIDTIRRLEEFGEIIINEGAYDEP